MSRLLPDGSVQFDASVSTLNYGSLERGTLSTPLVWPGQQGMYNFPLDQLARRFYEKDRLEFLCMREILFHGKEQGNAMRAASLDTLFGVRFTWPYEARKGERYVFTFQGEPPPEAPGPDMQVNDLEMPDLILINGVQIWERGFGETLFVNIEYVAPKNGPLEMTLLKDRFRTIRDAYKGYGNKLAMVHATCRGYVHLHMGLKLACEHFGPCDKPPTRGQPLTLPAGMRTFMNPGPWTWVEDEGVPGYDYQPVPSPEYPTADVVYNQFHDLYLDNPERFKLHAGLWDSPEIMRNLVRLSLDNGIRCFPQTEPVLQALEAEGLRESADIALFFSGGYIKRKRGVEHETYEDQRRRRKEEGKRLADLMRRFPRALVVYRLNEFSGCQYSHVTVVPEDRARAWPKPWYEFAQSADAINREALNELLEEARAVDAKRLSVGANVQTGHLSSHPFHCGADFTIEKTIGRHQVNLVVANSRGMNMAFGRRIGMQHDAWGGLNYNRDSEREITSIHRSFFFNGAQFHDAEFGSVARTQDGKASFNKKGMAWIQITRLAAIHPRRGMQRVRLGFLKGSDQIWDWFYPSTHTMGPRDFNGYDPADPKEYVDFNLLNIPFPSFGTWQSYNPERWLTGTPYGPCDLLPWDAPLKTLKRYAVLPMLGAHRMEPRWWQTYRKYVQQGGTLVLALYQLLAPGRDRVYFKQDVSDLLGVKLGQDRLMNEFETLFDRQFFMSHHYNQVKLEGAKVVQRLPNGEPLATRFKLGKGRVYFFTTDRLTSVSGVAQDLIASLFAPHMPVLLNPGHDQMEIAVSEKKHLRLITLMDHGRDRLPTDAGPDTGPYCGRVTFDLKNLGLSKGRYEVLQVLPNKAITKLKLKPLPCRQRKGTLEVQLKRMGPYAELALGPKGKAEKRFFWA